MAHKTQQRGINIDLTSLVIGFLLGFCIMLASGYSSNNNTGRYQCSAADTGSVFILDTQTGHTWRVNDSTTVDLGTPQDRRSMETHVTRKVK